VVAMECHLLEPRTEACRGRHRGWADVASAFGGWASARLCGAGVRSVVCVQRAPFVTQLLSRLWGLALAARPCRLFMRAHAGLPCGLHGLRPRCRVVVGLVVVLVNIVALLLCGFLEALVVVSGGCAYCVVS